MAKQTITADVAHAAAEADAQVSEHLALTRQMCAYLATLAAPLLEPPHRRALVDSYQSAASALSVSLPAVRGSMTLVKTILYSASAAAVLTIGQRSIAVPAATLQPLQVEQLVLYPNEVVSLALSGASPTAGPLHLEIIGVAISPHERMEVIH